MKFTKFMRGILIGMCVLALSGCGVSEGGGSQNTDYNAANDNAANDNTANDNTANDNTANDNAANDNTVNDSKENDTSNAADHAGTSDNIDGENLIRSSDLQGSVVEFSDSGCIVALVTKEDENTAAVSAPGNENEETNVNISYKTDCIFQKADINITTGKTGINDASISDIKKQTSLLIYGDFEDTHHLTAEKIVIVRYK